jgi:hypothetical protein
MTIFNSYVSLPKGTPHGIMWDTDHHVNPILGALVSSIPQMDPKAKIREMRDALRLGAPHHAAKQLYRLCTLCLCIFDPDMMLHPNWLVVSTPLKNMKVSWDDFSQYLEKYI